MGIWWEYGGNMVGNMVGCCCVEEVYAASRQVFKELFCKFMGEMFRE